MTPEHVRSTAAESLELTVLMLSCRRLDLLERTLAAARAHFFRVEPAARVAWVCFDSGSAPGDRRALDALGFDLLLLSRENLGQGPALKHLFAAARTDLVLLLEDDWELRNPAGVAFLHECAAVLRSDPNLATVKLDALHFLDFDARTRYDGPFQASGGSVPFYVHDPRSAWGGLCFSPSVTRLDALRHVGPVREDQPFRKWWAESELTARLARQFHAVKSPEMLLFHHLGGDRPCEAWDVPRATDAADERTRTTDGGGAKPQAQSLLREAP